jgi:hypothetical protein
MNTKSLLNQSFLFVRQGGSAYQRDSKDFNKSPQKHPENTLHIDIEINR